MFRSALPAALVFGLPAAASDLPSCENIPFSSENCVRVLACVGLDGDWFDGQARGWDTGIVIGHLDNGARCGGEWQAGGTLRAGTATLSCEDGLTAEVLYYSLDNETGTAIGRGITADGRPVRVWSGEKVLDYLTPDGAVTAELPCGVSPVPIS